MFMMIRQVRSVNDRTCLFLAMINRLFCGLLTKSEPHNDYQKLMRKDSKYLYNHKASSHSEKALEKLAMIPAEKGKECLPEELWGKQKFNTTW